MDDECWFCHRKRCNCNRVTEEPDPEDRELTLHERLTLAEEFRAMSDGTLPDPGWEDEDA